MIKSIILKRHIKCSSLKSPESPGPNTCGLILTLFLFVSLVLLPLINIVPEFRCISTRLAALIEAVRPQLNLVLTLGEYLQEVSVRQYLPCLDKVHIDLVMDLPRRSQLLMSRVK